MQGVGAGDLDPCTTFPTPPPPPPFANETIGNPQSIHVFLVLNHLQCQKWGKLRNNGQYFVIEKKRIKGRKSRKEEVGSGITKCGRRECPPPPLPAPPPLPHYYKMFPALQYHNQFATCSVYTFTMSQRYTVWVTLFQQFP